MFHSYVKLPEVPPTWSGFMHAAYLSCKSVKIWVVWNRKTYVVACCCCTTGRLGMPYVIYDYDHHSHTVWWRWLPNWSQMACDLSSGKGTSSKIHGRKCVSFPSEHDGHCHFGGYAWNVRGVSGGFLKNHHPTLELGTWRKPKYLPPAFCWFKSCWVSS